MDYEVLLKSMQELIKKTKDLQDSQKFRMIPMPEQALPEEEPGRKPPHRKYFRQSESGSFRSN